MWTTDVTTTTPFRQVRARFDERTITLYQAVPRLLPERTTWLKPSFLWTMHGCGWAQRPGRERVLAVTITREGFEAALRESSLRRFERGLGLDRADFVNRLREVPGRVRWDAERSLRLARLPHHSLHLGLGGALTRIHLREWITGVDDVTSLARAVQSRLAAGKDEAARALLPEERPYPLPDDVARLIGATHLPLAA